MSQGTANPNISTSGSTKVMPVLANDYGAADEGSFFVATLANTASTSTAATTQALADNNPSFALFNNAPTGGPNVYLRYIKVRVTAVGGSNTSLNYSSIVEQRQDKLTSTGTALGTPVNTNTSSSVQSKLTGNAGVLLAAAANASLRRVGDGQIVGAVEVAFDEWIFDFGPPVWGKSLIGTTTLVSARTVPHAPVVLAPGWWFTLGFWGASKAAAASTYGWEVGYIERPSGQ